MVIIAITKTEIFSLILQCGRLLIRKFLSEHLKVPYDILQLKRTEKGKPFLGNIDYLQIKPTPHFNMAHNGDFVVLATHPQAKVGIDIMKIESPSKWKIFSFLFFVLGFFFFFK